MESSNLEVNKNSKENEENHKTDRIYGTSQNAKSPNGGKENAKLLTYERSQILSSNCREENTCEVLEKIKMNSKLMTGLGKTETKILKKLRKPVPLYMSSKDSDEKMNTKTTNILKDMDGMKASERMVDYSECKPIGSLTLLKFDARTIPPDVHAKISPNLKK